MTLKAEPTSPKVERAEGSLRFRPIHLDDEK